MSGPGLVEEFAAFVGAVPYREVALPWGGTRVWDLGEGRPVVLLHGVAGGRRPFFRLAPLLARSRRVIVPPLRGEERPAPKATWPELVADLGALLEALDLRDATLFGTSFGGAVALAHAGGPRVAEIVVQGTFARFRLRSADRLAHALSYLLPARLGSAYFARRVRLGPEVRLLARHAPGVDGLFPAWMERTPFATLRRRVRLIGAPPPARRAAVPLTLAHGEEDRVVPRAFHDRLRALHPDARAVLLPEVGHNAALSHPERVAELLTSPARPAP